jgi:hypothetical protein
MVACFGWLFGAAVAESKSNRFQNSQTSPMLGTHSRQSSTSPERAKDSVYVEMLIRPMFLR